MQSFIIPGPPEGKDRPRLGDGHVYTTIKTGSYEEYVRYSFYKELGRPEITDKYLQIAIDIYFPIPKNTTKKQKEQMISGELRPDKKPDVDNVAKVILDAFNGFLYKDDKQVIELLVRKYYSMVPKVVVTFGPIEKSHG